MAKTIWKFKLDTTEVQYIEMPHGAEVLTVQMQAGDVCIWVLVDMDEERKVQRRFHIFGTGYPIDVRIELRYIGTYQLQGGLLVFHVFEPIPQS